MLHVYTMHYNNTALCLCVLSCNVVHCACVNIFTYTVHVYPHVSLTY